MVVIEDVWHHQWYACLMCVNDIFWSSQRWWMVSLCTLYEIRWRPKWVSSLFSSLVSWMYLLHDSHWGWLQVLSCDEDVLLACYAVNYPLFPLKSHFIDWKSIQVILQICDHAHYERRTLINGLGCAFHGERYLPVANLVLALLAEIVLYRHQRHASLAMWHHLSRPITLTILGVLDHCVVLKVVESDRNCQLQRRCCRDSFTFQMSERLLTAIVYIHCFPASAWNLMRSTCVRCFIL